MVRKNILFKSVLAVLMLIVCVNPIVAHSELDSKDKKEKKMKEERKSSLKQDEIELVCSSDGSSKDEAVKNALRLAIEQTYGTFVSSNTTILNDDIVRDEIATVSSGNVKEYEIIAEQSKENGYMVTLRAVVSVGKLVKYAKSKGGTAELAGATFAMNVKLKELQIKNETVALQNLSKQLAEMAPYMFDYSVSAGEPVEEKGLYRVNLTITAKANETAVSMYKFFYNTIKSVAVAYEKDGKFVSGDPIEYQKIIGNNSFYIHKYNIQFSYPKYAEEGSQKYRSNTSPIGYDRESFFFRSPCGFVVREYLDAIEKSARNVIVKDNIGTIITNRDIYVDYKKKEEAIERWKNEFYSYKKLFFKLRERRKAALSNQKRKYEVWEDKPLSDKQYKKEKEILLKDVTRIANEGPWNCQQIDGDSGPLVPNKLSSYYFLKTSKTYTLDQISKISKFTVEPNRK